MSASRAVVVVDDDAEMQDSIAFLLTVNGRTPVVHGSAESLLAAGVPAGAGCILADVRLGPGMDGVALVEALRRRGERTPVVVITGHADVPLAVRAMRVGALDVVEKPFQAERLLGAIAEAEKAAAPAPAASGAAHGATETSSRLGTLTPRELQVLRGLVAGQANKVIAADLAISPRTVETYRASVMDKLGCRSFAEVVRMALAAGLAD